MVGDHAHIDQQHLHEHHHYSATQYPQHLTAKLPSISPEKIIGRHDDLEDLHRRPFDNKQVVLVNGLGGIGKTALSQAYVGKYLEEYRHAAWFSLVTDDIPSDILNTEAVLDNLSINAEGKDAGTIFIEILTRLKQINEKPCLLIFDNADASLAEWYDYLPHQPKWHILVTSRERIENFDLKDLDSLSEDDAITLFLTHYRRGNLDREQIRDLVRDVELHTLTIEILAKTAQLQRTGPHELMRAIKNDLKANVYVRHKGDKIDSVTSYLCTIFSLSKLDKAEL